MSERVPFSDVRKGDRITFKGGYYMTGTVTQVVGTHAGSKMITFLEDGAERDRVVKYAAHRGVERHEA